MALPSSIAIFIRYGRTCRRSGKRSATSRHSVSCRLAPPGTWRCAEPRRTGSGCRLRPSDFDALSTGTLRCGYERSADHISRRCIEGLVALPSPPKRALGIPAADRAALLRSHERVWRMERDAAHAQRVQDELVGRLIGCELLRRYHAGELHLAGGDPAREGGAGESGGSRHR